MDYIKYIFNTYIYDSTNEYKKFSKPSGYKNINTSSVIKKQPLKTLF